MIRHILQKSLQNDLIITIMYEKSGAITKRDIKVMRIDEDRICAFCYLRNQVREFKTENILAAELNSRSTYP